METIDGYAKIAEKLPFVRWSFDAEVTELRNGEVCVFIAVPGVDSSAHTDETLSVMSGVKEEFLTHLPADISMTIITTRWKKEVGNLMGSFFQPGSTAQSIDKQWTEGLGAGYETKTVIQLVSATPSGVDKLLDKAAGTGISGVEAKAVDLVVEAGEICGRLKSFGARIMKGEEAGQFIIEYMAGQTLRPMNQEAGYYEINPAADVAWPRRKNHSERAGPESKFTATLSIAGLGKTVSTSTMATIHDLPISFIVTSTILPLPAGKESVRQKSSITRRGIGRSTVQHIEEVDALVDAYNSAAAAPLQHALNVEVISNSLEFLEKDVAAISAILHAEGLNVSRETKQQETSFWGRLPGEGHTLPRQRVRSSSVVSRLLPFIGPASGLKKCTWGNSPLAAFKTQSGGIYGYTHHGSEDQKALGNVAIFGASGQGKTTLASFLISQASRFENYRTLAFDRLNGMKVFTHHSGGEHYDFAVGTEINPFSISPTSKNSAFLTSFLVMLMGVKSDADINAIAEGVADIMEAKEEGYVGHLTDIEALLGPDGSPLREALRKWLPTGAYGDYFNGEYDALEFKSSLVTLDMTQLLDRPEVLGPMAYYILHRLKIEVQESPAPYAVFIDEANKYVTSEVFAPIVRELASEIRKTDGVLIVAAQSPKALLDHKVGREIMTNMATILVFPDPAADWADYGPEGLDLNLVEFGWVKKSHSRQVLVKKRGKEGSAILNVDLSPLGEMMAFFDSSSSAVKNLQSI